MTREIAEREKPIILYPHEVRAVLDGRQTQVRRVIKPQPQKMSEDGRAWSWIREKGRATKRTVSGSEEALRDSISDLCPHGTIGYRLWVRETLANDGDVSFMYSADGFYVPCPVAWLHRNSHKGVIPSIHMPRWASRITLEITDVRVQRVQDISEEDAKAEGVELEDWILDFPMGECPELYKDAFRFLWDSINAKRGFGWDVNPWVWALTFKRLTP